MAEGDVCGKQMTKKKQEYALLGQILGKFGAMVCPCGQVVFDGTEFEKIEAVAKKKGVWGVGRASRTSIGTSGNALDVRLPKSVVDFLELKKGQEVLIEPLDKKRFQVIVS